MIINFHLCVSRFSNACTFVVVVVVSLWLCTSTSIILIGKRGFSVDVVETTSFANFAFQFCVVCIFGSILSGAFTFASVFVFGTVFFFTFASVFVFTFVLGGVSVFVLGGVNVFVLGGVSVFVLSGVCDVLCIFFV